MRAAMPLAALMAFLLKVPSILVVTCSGRMQAVDVKNVRKAKQPGTIWDVKHSWNRLGSKLMEAMMLSNVWGMDVWTTLGMQLSSAELLNMKFSNVSNVERFSNAMDMEFCNKSRVLLPLGAKQLSNIWGFESWTMVGMKLKRANNKSRVLLFLEARQLSFIWGVESWTMMGMKQGANNKSRVLLSLEAMQLSIIWGGESWTMLGMKLMKVNNKSRVLLPLEAKQFQLSSIWGVESWTLGMKIMNANNKCRVLLPVGTKQHLDSQLSKV